MRLTRLDPFSIINLMEVPTNGEANIHLLKITRKQINGLNRDLSASDLQKLNLINIRYFVGTLHNGRPQYGTFVNIRLLRESPYTLRSYIQ